jgi:hypothetical protein
MISMDEARTRVARGVMYLDGKWPEWADHIDVVTLDMATPCDCVLGQMTGDYNKAIRKLWPEPLWRRLFSIHHDLSQDTGVLLGFDAPFSEFKLERDVDFQRLKDAWIEVIASRRTRVDTLVELVPGCGVAVPATVLT